MKKLALILFAALSGSILLQAQPVHISGRVVEADGETPIPGAVVRLDENYLWSVTYADGAFSVIG